MTNNGKIATITLEVTIYGDRVECFANGTKWTSAHGGKCIKTTPYMSIYGPGVTHTPVGDTEDKSLKQAILEATEPQIDFSMDDLGLIEQTDDFGQRVWAEVVTNNPNMR